jgi:DNA modification methylase
MSQRSTATIAEPLRPLAVPIASLNLDPANARRHPEKNLDAIRSSLAQFGQRKPIVVQRTGMIVRAGNGTLLAARALGWTEIAAVVIDDDNATALQFAIADNRTAELAEWDDEVLAQLLQGMDEATRQVVGFDEGDFEAILGSLAAGTGGPVNDEGPDAPPEVATARRGDLWVLGDHRLLCGDSTSLDDVRRLMAGEKAALVATDPPYLVDYTGERPNDTGKDWSDKYREIDIKDADGFFRAVFTNVLDVLGPKGAIYCWHAHKRCGDIQRIWRELGILDHQQIIWVKPTPVFGRVYWHFRHEPCVMGWRQGDKPEHDGVHDHDSVWVVDWEGKARVVGNEHPTQKPIELFARPMRKHTKARDLVFEPFSGSGSQLIAAQVEGRRCRAMEISPPFVDVAIRRWEKATGRTATLDGDGRTFAEVAAERAAEPANPVS